MNKCKIDQQFYKQIVDGLRTKNKLSKKVRNFIIKWTPNLKHGKLFWGQKEVIPYEMTEKVLKREAEQNGMPLSRDGAFNYLKKKYVGFKKRRINEWLKRVEQLQMLKIRPHRYTRENKNTREGTKNYFMKKGNQFSVGIDLFEIGRSSWTKYKFFFVAVMQRSGLTFAYPMHNKKAASSLVQLKKVYAECKKRFGRGFTEVSSDKGVEFLGAVNTWLKQKKIPHRTLTGRTTMCWWAEKKMSQFGPDFGDLDDFDGSRRYWTDLRNHERI